MTKVHKPINVRAAFSPFDSGEVMLPNIFTPGGHQALNWEKAEERVRELSSQIIYSQIEDILKTLPAADAMDRDRESRVPGAQRSARGGLYRDELSVYRRELSRRMTMKPCKECGK